MNNFRKHCAFYIITFAHWRPQEGARVGAHPAPPGNDKTMKFFSPCEVPLFSFWGGGLVFSFGGHLPFSPLGGGGGGFSLCVKIFMLIPTCKNFHALDAKVVAKIAPWENLREIARLERYPIC